MGLSIYESTALINIGKRNGKGQQIIVLYIVQAMLIANIPKAQPKKPAKRKCQQRYRHVLLTMFYISRERDTPLMGMN